MRITMRNDCRVSGANGNFGMRIEVSREDELLDTGGGLKKSGWFFLEGGGGSDEPFIVHNVDVISTIDLAAHGAVSTSRTLWRRWQFRTGRRRATCSSTSMAHSAAVSGRDGRTLKWCGPRRGCNRWRFPEFTSSLLRIFSKWKNRRVFYH